MELHRNTGRSVRLAIGMTALGVLAIALPFVISLFDMAFLFGPWVWYIVGALVTGAGVYTLRSSLRPFRIRIDSDTITVRAAGLNAVVPWDAVSAITIEGLSYLPESASRYLVLWPADGIDLGAKPSYRKGDHVGFLLVELDDLHEPVPEVVSALQRFAGPRFAEV
jgi:hypothetical protein